MITFRLTDEQATALLQLLTQQNQLTDEAATLAQVVNEAMVQRDTIAPGVAATTAIDDLISVLEEERHPEEANDLRAGVTPQQIVTDLEATNGYRYRKLIDLITNHPAYTQ